MAKSINKVTLVGNIGGDPTFRTFESGDRVCKFSIATGESWKDKTTGDVKERTEWHNIVIYNQGLVKVAEKILKKGSRVYIEGALETRKVEKDGATFYYTEVVMRPGRGEIVLMDSKRDDKSDDNDDALIQDYVDVPPASTTRGGRGRSAASNGRVDHDFGDDIPF